MNYLKIFAVCLMLAVGGGVRAQEREARAVYDTHTLMEQIEEARRMSQVDADAAIGKFEESLQLSNELAFAEGAISCLQHLGTMYASKGMYAECMNMYRNQIRYSGRPGPLIAALPLVSNGMGNLYKLQGRYDEAAKAYYQAIETAERLGIRTSGSVYNNLASVLHFQNNPDQSLEYLRKAAVMAMMQRDYELLGSVLTNTGLIFKDSDQPDSSIWYFRKALELTSRTGNQITKFTTLTNIAQQHLKLGDAKMALEYLRSGQQVSANVDPYYRVTALETMGLAYEMEGDLASAIKYLERGLKTAQRHRLNENVMSMNEKLAQVYAIGGDYEKAFAFLDAGKRMRDSIHNREVTEAIGLLEVKYRTAEQQKNIAHQQLKLSRQEGALKRKNFLLWLAAGGIGALIISLALSYSLFRSKRRLQQHKIQILEQETDLLSRGQEIEKLQATINGEEKERNRIARELHDGIGGMLTAVNMNLKALYNKTIPDEFSEELNEIIMMLEETAVEVRETAHNLMPGLLLHYNMDEALQMYCDRINKEGLQLNLQVHGSTALLDKFTALSVFRIIQELVQNIVKHSQATIATIQLRTSEEEIFITVEDNGVGFDQDEQREGLGLQNIQSRVRALEGYCHVASARGMGTTVHIEIELQKTKTAVYEDSHSDS